MVEILVYLEPVVLEVGQRMLNHQRVDAASTMVGVNHDIAAVHSVEVLSCSVSGGYASPETHSYSCSAVLCDDYRCVSLDVGVLHVLPPEIFACHLVAEDLFKGFKELIQVFIPEPSR